MTGYVPCGACAAYVPATTGCQHWRPRVARAALAFQAERRNRERRARENARAAVAAFRETMTR